MENLMNENDANKLHNLNFFSIFSSPRLVCNLMQFTFNGFIAVELFQ